MTHSFSSTLVQGAVSTRGVNEDRLTLVVLNQSTQQSG
jgi:hypothetical protein